MARRLLTRLLQLDSFIGDGPALPNVPYVPPPAISFPPPLPNRPPLRPPAPTPNGGSAPDTPGIPQPNTPRPTQKNVSPPSPLPAPAPRVPGLPDWPYAFLVSQVDVFEDWCLDAKNGVTDGSDLGLHPCDFSNSPDSQLFIIDEDGKIHSKVNPFQCLAVGNGSNNVSGGARIKFLSCSANVLYNTFDHDKSTDLITVAKDSLYCLRQTGNGADESDTIRAELCDPTNFGFLFDYDDFDCSSSTYTDVDCCDDNECSGTDTCGSNYKCSTPSEDVVDPDPNVPDWPFARIISHGSWCLDAKNGVASGSDVGLKRCIFPNPPDRQLFMIDKQGKIHTKVDTSKCLAVDGSNIRGGARIKFFDCDASDVSNTFEHDKTIEKISIAQDSTFCFKQTGNGPDGTDTIRAELCTDRNTPVYEYDDFGCSAANFADVDCCIDSDCSGSTTCDENYECV